MEDSTSKDFLDELFAEDDEWRNQQRAEIACIKQNTPEKEQFNIHKFGEIYSLRGDLSGEILISPEIIEEYEVEYYLENPALRTLREYADYRKNLDRWDCN